MTSNSFKLQCNINRLNSSDDLKGASIYTISRNSIAITGNFGENFMIQEKPVNQKERKAPRGEEEGDRIAAKGWVR